MKTSEILKQVLNRVEPSEKELAEIGNSLEKILSMIKKRLKVLKINAEIFVGGSYAKKTMIRKDLYDIDIFLRFSKEHRDISRLTKKILSGIKNVSMVHGSRDYFRIKENPNLCFELIPVLKIKNSKEAENITDLSYSHVKYVNKKMKGKILDEIKIAKAFCYANNCYGAESYIQGFSGYSLELLVYHYGNFLKFIRAVTKIKGKEIVDIEKQYKNKQEVLMNVNTSKLESPIILIDPTYMQRNALAALSEETFEKFKKECENFLKNPSMNSFEVKKTDLNKIRDNAKKNGHEFILLEVKTGKQEGNIAGSKLLKFYRHLSEEIKEFFEIKDEGFNYNSRKSARYFFVVKRKKEILLEGPLVHDEKNSFAFRKKHKNVHEKKGRLYVREKIDFGIKKFIENWMRKNKRKVKDMFVEKVRIL